MDEKPVILAFIMPRDIKRKGDLLDYLVTVDDIENATGLDFMAELPDGVESELESRTEEKIW